MNVCLACQHAARVIIKRVRGSPHLQFDTMDLHKPGADGAVASVQSSLVGVPRLRRVSSSLRGSSKRPAAATETRECVSATEESCWDSYY